MHLYDLRWTPGVTASFMQWTSDEARGPCIKTQILSDLFYPVFTGYFHRNPSVIKPWDHFIMPVSRWRTWHNPLFWQLLKKSLQSFDKQGFTGRLKLFRTELKLSLRTDPGCAACVSDVIKMAIKIPLKRRQTFFETGKFETENRGIQILIGLWSPTWSS